jgi:hypothetical protein
MEQIKFTTALPLTFIEQRLKGPEA